MTSISTSSSDAPWSTRNTPGAPASTATRAAWIALMRLTGWMTGQEDAWLAEDL